MRMDCFDLAVFPQKRVHSSNSQEFSLSPLNSDTFLTFLLTVQVSSLAFVDLYTRAGVLHGYKESKK